MVRTLVSPTVLGSLALFLVGVLGCSSEPSVNDAVSGSGGANGSPASTGTGAASGSGGAAGGTRATPSDGGQNPTGGTASGGLDASGGMNGLGGSGVSGGGTTGGSAGTGEDATGGVSTGGSTAAGGNSADGGTGGAGTGGATSTGGANTGGVSTGGSGTGGDEERCAAGASEVEVRGRQLYVNGAAFHIRGVCWNAVPKGGSHPADLDYPGFAPTDIGLMKAAGINTVRTYEPLTSTDVLDQLCEAGIYVLDTVYPSGTDLDAVVSRVNTLKSHPAILGWVLGNEWNMNHLYTDGVSVEQAQSYIQQVAGQIHSADSGHPVLTIWGGLPTSAVVDAMTNIDIWGVNVYGGSSFGSLFTQWSSLSTKPMMLTEYGADAWDTTNNREDPTAQADAVGALTDEIFDNSSALTQSGVCVGGTIFEWADEWWKASGGDANTHETTGMGSNGPPPDGVFNEEWWGLVDIDRNPRPAYDALAERYLGTR